MSAIQIQPQPLRRRRRTTQPIPAERMEVLQQQTQIRQRIQVQIPVIMAGIVQQHQVVRVHHLQIAVQQIQPEVQVQHHLQEDKNEKDFCIDPVFG